MKKYEKPFLKAKRQNFMKKIIVSILMMLTWLYVCLVAMALMIIRELLELYR